MLNEDATSSKNRRFKVLKSGDGYLLDYYGNNKSNIKLYIDSNNFLRKIIISKGVEKITLDETKPDKMIQALSNILPFDDKVANKRAAEKKENDEKEKHFTQNNMLNFDKHLPLFAGLRWDDTLSSVVDKLRKAPGFTITSIGCGITDDVPSRESPLGQVILEVLHGEPQSMTIDQLRSVEKFLAECYVHGKMILADTEATLIAKVGASKSGSESAPFVYLNRIGIQGEFSNSKSRLMNLFKNKYKDYEITGPDWSREITDRFGSNINIRDNGIDYMKALEISDLQKEQQQKAAAEKQQNELKSKPQADDAL